ncbi:12480_t:CDS:2, partial [Cetraspora pellucida]
TAKIVNDKIMINTFEDKFIVQQKSTYADKDHLALLTKKVKKQDKKIAYKLVSLNITVNKKQMPLGFSNHNEIYQIPLHEEAASVDYATIAELLPVLQNKCENVIYEVSSNDKIIEKLVGVFNSENANESNKTDNIDENNDSNELPIISANAALENLNSVRLFLL